MKKIILSTLLLHVIIFCFSQRKLTKQIVENRITINYPDSSITAFVLPSNKNISVDDNKLYYWYKSDRIRTSRGGYGGKLLHGEYKQFYGNLNLQSTGKFKKGLKTGTWKTWYLNGELKKISHWKNGMKNGQLILYDEQNSPIEEHNYRNDEIKNQPIKFDKSGKKIKPEKKKTGKKLFNSLFEKKSEKVPKQPKLKKEKSNKTGQTNIISTAPPVTK